MAYTDNRLPDELNALTTVDDTDVFIIGDQSDSDRAKKITKSDLVTDFYTAIEPSLVAGYQPLDADLTTIAAASNGSVLAATTASFMFSDKSKLNGIEAGADVTDATNVDAAGAVMNSDTSTASMSFVVDEDDMVSDSDTKVPTQQSVRAYVETEIAAVPQASETGINTDQDGTWMTFTATIPELDAGSGSRGWTILNEDSFSMNGGYAQIVDTGGNAATAGFKIPGAFDSNDSYNGNNEIKVKFYLRASDTSSAILFGISNVVNKTAVDGEKGVFFELDGGTPDYNATTHNGSSGTEATISAVTYTNWTEYVIHFRPGVDARFYVNGTLVSTNTTTLPSGALNYCNLYAESCTLSFTDVTVSLKSS